MRKAGDYDGQERVQRDGVTGFVFEQRNRNALIGCVRKFMKMTNEERKAMGIAGREKMVREFDREIVVGDYMDEITKVQRNQKG